MNKLKSFGSKAAGQATSAAVDAGAGALAEQTGIELPEEVTGAIADAAGDAVNNAAADALNVEQPEEEGKDATSAAASACCPCTT